jgi:hypothetical protein
MHLSYFIVVQYDIVSIDRRMQSRIFIFAEVLFIWLVDPFTISFLLWQIGLKVDFGCVGKTLIE